MKYVITEEICDMYGLSVEELLYGILLQANVDFHKLKDSLYDKYMLDDEYKPTKEFREKIQKILLESDNTVPSPNDCEILAIRLRELYPKGKSSTGYPWRGNIRDLTLKLQKFYKLYGKKWSADEIYEATKKYVEGFNGNYTYMRLLNYFILKGNESDLATQLETSDVNDINDDWTSTNI